MLKPTAMTPLSALLAEAAGKMKPPLDPAHCSLVLGKKPLADLTCPWRLANIPNGSALALVYDKPPAGATIGRCMHDEEWAVVREWWGAAHGKGLALQGLGRQAPANGRRGG